MMFFKKALFFIYVFLIGVMAVATIVEHCTSTPFVSEHIYGDGGSLFCGLCWPQWASSILSGGT